MTPLILSLALIAWDSVDHGASWHTVDSCTAEEVFGSVLPADTNGDGTVEDLLRYRYAICPEPGDPPTEGRRVTCRTFWQWYDGPRTRWWCGRYGQVPYRPGAAMDDRYEWTELGRPFQPGDNCDAECRFVAPLRWHVDPTVISDPETRDEMWIVAVAVTWDGFVEVESCSWSDHAVIEGGDVCEIIGRQQAGEEGPCASQARQ